MGSAQARQRPRRMRNDTTGMLSSHNSCALQRGQAERVRKRLRCSGTRTITTLRKLPMTRPKSPTATSIPADYPSATACSVATSPGLKECSFDPSGELPVELPEDSARRARGDLVARLEVQPGQPEPGLRQVVLECDRFAERDQRLGWSPEIRIRVAQVDVGERVLGLECERALEMVERLAWPTGVQQRGA